jgi:ubiquitin C-terminal hydrolase
MEWEIVWKCVCNAIQPLPFGTNVDCIGIHSLAILPDGMADSVQQAIDREMAPEELGNHTCVTCGQMRMRTQTKRIEGAPDILRIKINNVEQEVDEDGNVTIVRNNNYIRLSPVLDLQQYQAVPAYPAPLRYKLTSVLCHVEVAEHWIATVTDKTRVNHVNDDVVQSHPAAYLETNPQDGGQAIVLTYTRIEPRGI